MAEFILYDQTRRFGRVLHYSGVMVLVAGLTASYSLLHSPIIEATEITSERIEELTLSVQNAPAIREQYQKTSERLSTAKERIATAHKRVPKEADMGGFYNEVSRIATEERLAVREFKPGQPTVRNGYGQLEVTLTGRGNYASVCAFFDRLAKLNRLSKLENLLLTASNSAEYPIEVKLVIFFGLRGKEAEASTEVKRG
jgi:Tfp pilus assembly protein PilO